jgi:predicted Zn-dependent protease
MKTFLRSLFVAALAGAALLTLTGCQIVPETGRSQLVLISGAQEAQLGLQSFADTKKSVPISKDAKANALLQKVGKRIAAVASQSLPNAQWEFVVFESKEANAFCLPGGKVGIYTGILPVTQDEAGLATVMGHEVAHAIARHGAERMSEAMVMEAGGSLLGAAMNSADPRWQAATALAYGVGSKLGRELPHSRAQESEADNIGLTYMARAGYDPQQAVKFWERFADYGRTHSDGSTPEFLRTHPTDATRIQQLQGLMPRALEEYRKATGK